jgi:hypothetical protein
MTTEKEVQEHYNKNINIEICCFYECKGEWYIDVWIEKEKSAETIGFYEWLFNPKYKVFEVFRIKPFIINKESDSGAIKMTTSNLNYLRFKQPPEILSYLQSQIKGGV